MPLVPADQPQLIRSCQKDEFYRRSLTNSANELVHTCAGSRRWLQWRKEVELVSDLSYYVLTTLSGYQTLGEEYVSIVQVDPSGRRVPSRVRRTALVLFHSLLPYLLEKLLVCVENELETDTQPLAVRSWSPLLPLRCWVRRVLEKLPDARKKSLPPLVSGLQQGMDLLQRLHLAIFFISGTFYHISKRAVSIRYVRVGRASTDEPRIRSSFGLLGALSLLQVALGLALQFNSCRQKQRARQQWKQQRSMQSSAQDVQPTSRSSRCILCLEERRNSTCTPCGHLFCWECITEWCGTKSECPLCREQFQPHRLLYLRS